MIPDRPPKGKSELRSMLRKVRGNLPPEARATLSRSAASILAESELFAGARTIALYAACRDEADPSELERRALAQGAQVAYPRVDGDELQFHFACLAELRTGAFEIREPSPVSPIAPIHAIDLFIVPGLGFSQLGARLGYGRGYYDRVLRFARTWSHPCTFAVGFCFECQVRDSIPQGPYDEPLDALVTENALHLVNPSAAHPRIRAG